MREVKLKYAFQTSLDPFHLYYIATGHVLTTLKTVNQEQEAEKCLMESCLPLILTYPYVFHILLQLL